MEEQGWGRTVILGVEGQGNPLSLNCREMMRGRGVVGSLFGGVKPKSDIPSFVQKYLNKVGPNTLCSAPSFTIACLRETRKAYE